MTDLSKYFGPWICKQLQNKGITTVEQANLLTDKELLRIRGFGRITLHNFRNKMQKPAKRFNTNMKIGTFVDVDFGVSGKIDAAEVVAIKETKTHVEFDLDVVISMGMTRKERTRIHGVYAGLCVERTPEYLETKFQEAMKGLPVMAGGDEAAIRTVQSIR